MVVNKHINFLIANNPELFAYLDAHHIPYKEVLHSCVFDISESDPHWEQISLLLQRSRFVCISDTYYTKQELSEAAWLTMRSLWRCGYPQPEDGPGYESVTYSMDGYCSSCGSGLVQNSEFRIKKPPKWGKRHFMMLNWVGDEIFVDDITKTLLSQSGLTGFSFRDVYDKKGANAFEDISQLYIENLLPDGLSTDSRYIDQVNRCPVCGIAKYHSTGIGSLAFREEIFDKAPDIVRTSEIFGWEHWTQREIIVSQRFYQFVIANNLGSALEFKPMYLERC